MINTKQMYLPGLPVRCINETEVPMGLAVLDRATGQIGYVSGMREDAAECLEVYITMDGGKTEKKRYQFRDLVVL